MQNKTSIMDIVNSNNITTQDALKIIARLSKEQVLETSEGGHNILHVLAADLKVHSSNLDIVSVVQAIVAKNPEVLNARLEILFTNPITNEAESLEGDTPFDMAIRQNNLVLVKVLAPHCKGLKDIRIFDYSPGKQRLKTQKEIADQKTRTLEYNEKNDYNTETEPLPTKTVDNIREYISPLAFCLRHGQFEMFKYLFKNGFGEKIKGAEDRSKYDLDTTKGLQKLYKDLFVAGNKELLKELHGHLGYYEGHEGENSPELIAALRADNQKEALKLISQGHYVYDFTAFSSWGDNKIMNFLFLSNLHHPNYNFSAKENEDWTPLQLAVEKGYKEVAVAILEAAKGNGIDLKTLFAPINYGMTHLHYVAYFGKKETAVLLLEAAKGNPELLKTLFAPDNDGSTPLHNAADRGHKEVAVAILEAAKGNPELLKTLFAPNNDGFTPLHFAAYDGHQKELVVLLLEAAEANPELLKTLFTPNNDGETPLHLAARYAYIDVVIILLAGRACQSLMLLNNTLSAKMNAMLGSAFIKNHASSAYSAGRDILEGASKALSGDVTDFYDEEHKKFQQKNIARDDNNNHQR